jgi:type I restriction enzyme S subunit
VIDRLKPYPSYKDSGVKWLGKVPEHWKVRRLRNAAEMRVSNVDKHTKDGEEPVRLCNYVDVYKNDRVRSGMSFMRATATSDEIERFRLQTGDVLITKDSEAWNDIGVPALVEETADDLISGYHIALLRPFTDRVDSEYLLRTLQSNCVAFQFHVEANGVTRYGLSHRAIKSICLPLPPLPEQTAIVRFLGYMDRRIQRLIRAKQRLIKLLEEQKQAIIHEAVTGRIDVSTGKPYPSYKDSGVKWLGKVPEHWKVRRLRNAAEMRVSNVDKHTKDGEEPVRLCNYVDVYKNDRVRSGMSFMRATATSDEIERFRLQTGDVLITKDSEAWNDIGVPALVEETADDLISGYHIALLRPFTDRVDSEYLLRTLQSNCVAFQFHVEANGVTRYGLSHRAIKSICLPLPPLPKQTAIVQYLDSHLASLSSSMESSRRAIDLLKEYRTRLISDVVTGKVDVREVAALLPDEPDDEPVEEPDADDEALDLDELEGAEEEGEE